VTGRRSDAALAIGYSTLLAACVIVSIGWLAVGAVVAVATYSPSVAAAITDQAATGNAWARGVLDAVPHSEPLGQAVLDYAFSGLNMLIGGILLFLGLRTWVTQLLAIAMIGSAGAFNLQAHAAAAAVQSATGLGIGGLHQILLHGVACAAYIVALLLLPAGRWQLGPVGGMGRLALLGVGVGTLVVVGVGTALLPHTVSCILFFGFAVPLAGLAVLPHRIRHGETAERRTQARLLFSVLLAAFGTCCVLAVLTLLLWYLGMPGLTLFDPTAHGSAEGAGQPTALLFWFCRLSAAGIAAAVLVAIRRGRLWRAERVFSRGLASMMVIVIVGGAYVVISAVAGWLPGTESGEGEVIAAAAATGLAALAFLPAYLRAERLVDRLLYGRRPAPYSVLADVAALSRASSSDGPNLAGVAESIGRGLGARSCRLTVLRPGLRDRTYAWSDGTEGDEPVEDHVVLPIRQGTDQIGSIAVDRGAVAGLHTERRTLLEDVADSLGAILQASRLGIELERQLRAALAHAEDIAVSRRQAVAEMDSERRMIERDLHDGAQHHLVSLRLALGLVEHEVSSGQLEQARERLNQLATQISTTEEVLAKTASGVSSIVLSERGLAAALATDLGGADPPIAVSFEGGVDERRFGPDIESAVYFCCLEAVNNTQKHAQGAPVAIRVGLAAGSLWFSVRDEGPGFDPGANAGSAGRGQRNLVARITAVGGRITVQSAPGAGTTVSGAVPVPAESTPTATQPVPPAVLRAAQMGDAGAGSGAAAGAGTTGAGPAGAGARSAAPAWAAGSAWSASGRRSAAAPAAAAPGAAALPAPTPTGAGAPGAAALPAPTPTGAGAPGAAVPGVAGPPTPTGAGAPGPAGQSAPAAATPAPPAPAASRSTASAPAASTPAVSATPTAATQAGTPVATGSAPDAAAAASATGSIGSAAPSTPDAATSETATSEAAAAAAATPAGPGPGAAGGRPEPSRVQPAAEATQWIRPRPAATSPGAEATQVIRVQPPPADSTQRITARPPDSPTVDATQRIPTRPSPANTPPAVAATQRITDPPTVDAAQRIPTALIAEATQLIPTRPVAGGPGRPVNGDHSLPAQARALIRAAQQIYPDGPERRQLAELADRLGQPSRVAVLGAAGAGTRTLLHALRNELFTPALELTDHDGVARQPADAVLMVLRGPGLEDASLFESPAEAPATDGTPSGGSPTGSAGTTDTGARATVAGRVPTVGVLARADELGGSTLDALERAKQIAADYRNDPDIAPHCQTVVPVAALLAVAGADLTEPEFQLLLGLSNRAPADLSEHTTPELLARLGWFGIEQALRLIRAGQAPNRGKLGDELVRLSGLPQLRELLSWRFARPAQALRVRATLTALEAVVRASPRRGPHADDLLYQLERVRSGAHELVEIDLADALRSGTLHLPGGDRQAAEQLLGADGPEPSARLGLPADAAPAAIRDAAGQQLVHWQRLASHPASTSAIRDAAEVLVRTCEELLAGSTH
jgi:signal transduction histidine kinase